jgi:hypothetical protein
MNNPKIVPRKIARDTAAEIRSEGMYLPLGDHFLTDPDKTTISRCRLSGY